MMYFLVKERSTLGTSCLETPILVILVDGRRNVGNFCLETATHGTFDVELLANNIIFKMVVAHPYPKVGQERWLEMLYTVV